MTIYLINAKPFTRDGEPKNRKLTVDTEDSPVPNYVQVRSGEKAQFYNGPKIVVEIQFGSYDAEEYLCDAFYQNTMPLPSEMEEDFVEQR